MTPATPKAGGRAVVNRAEAVTARCASIPCAELAERCEKATGPDLYLNEDILRFLGWTTTSWGAFDPNGQRGVSIPNYTASLDDAMSLIPEGWGWSLYSKYDNYERGEQPFRCALSAMPREHIGNNGASAALAICAAALRAHPTPETVK